MRILLKLEEPLAGVYSSLWDNPALEIVKGKHNDRFNKLVKPVLRGHY